MFYRVSQLQRKVLLLEKMAPLVFVTAGRC